MKLRGMLAEDFVNYKKPSMFLIFPYCTFKCDKENGNKICQNSSLINEPIIEISEKDLIELYIHNDISKSIICGGLEPMDSFDDLLSFIQLLRTEYNCLDDVVIYTGYYESELEKQLTELKKYDNIIIKFGRFIPNQSSHFDEVLGINLASENQYAKVIS